MSSIQPRKVGGVTVGWYSVLGKDKITGKRPRKYHRSRADAEAFIKSQDAHDIGTGVLYRDQHRIIACIQRLQEVGANLDDATEFYLKHGANKKPMPIGNVIEELITAKEQRGRGKNHINDLKIKLGTFSKHIKEDTLIGNITKEQVEKYIYVTQNSLSGVSKANHIRILSLLFNFAAKRGYLSMNPTNDIDPPKVKFKEPEVMTPEEFTTLLNHCFKNKKYDRLAVFVLQGFCGIRLEEATKLRWKNINLEGKLVTVSADIAKGSYYRTNPIPENALRWLFSIQDRRLTERPVIGANWKTLIRSVIHSAKIKHPKNCIRHSFCSYSIGAGLDKVEVSRCMGHGGDTSMIDNHYRNNVTKPDSLKWWAIVPNTNG